MDDKSDSNEHRGERPFAGTGIAKLIDHTFLGAAGERGAVGKLCREAKRYGFASVCVNPSEVPLAARLLAKSRVKVCTVIGFPLGATSVVAKYYEAVDALANGADELDFVVNQRLLKYDPALCFNELDVLSRLCHAEKPGTVLKLILECCNLTREEIVRGCRLAKKAGFDFVKTSTGFGRGGATVADVKLMRRTVGAKMGVKAAGGIRTREDALAMVAAGANRIGCSAGVAIVAGERTASR